MGKSWRKKISNKLKWFAILDFCVHMKNVRGCHIGSFTQPGTGSIIFTFALTSLIALALSFFGRKTLENYTQHRNRSFRHLFIPSDCFLFTFYPPQYTAIISFLCCFYIVLPFKTECQCVEEKEMSWDVLCLCSTPTKNRGKKLYTKKIQKIWKTVLLQSIRAKKSSLCNLKAKWFLSRIWRKFLWKTLSFVLDRIEKNFEMVKMW